MRSWLALFVTQSLLGAGRNLPLHRKLGWAGAGLAALIVIVGWYVGYSVVAGGKVGPVFSLAYFLALTFVQPALFGAMVFAAIANRKRTDWHRRLMLGALIVILEPLLGRLTIMGFIIAMGGPEPAIAYTAERLWLIPTIELGLQLAVLGSVMVLDRSIGGSVHPALWGTGAAFLALYAADAALASFAPFIRFAAGLGAG